MRFCLILLLMLGAAWRAAGQGAGPVPVPGVLAAPTLSVTDSERRYFELGDVLAKGAFAYTPLAQQAAHVSHSHVADAELDSIKKLAPEARLERLSAHDNFARALTLMEELDAPDDALTPVAVLAAHLSKPLPFVGDALSVSAFSKDSGTVLATLHESQLLSAVLETPALRAWTEVAGHDAAGPVWYAEGQMAGVAALASDLGRPDLLPPTPELATDLRGLRDWLSLRLPETPTLDQTTLQTDIDSFLQQTSAKGSHTKALTTDQLHKLGEISRLLGAQILPSDSPGSTPPTATQTSDEKRATRSGRPIVTVSTCERSRL